ncbi:MAG TPA: Wadjet anti-phage system protein JetD domain-containing protein [Hanamia sp.]|nr:Wadjet anti-phage system protein JetD domain-containing protein [Hanamia sp.]
MISPKDIQKICLQWWEEVLRSHIEGTQIFPREINRIGRVTSKDILTKLSDYQLSIEQLNHHAKPNRKYGYTLITEQRQFEKIGMQKVPIKVMIETLDDYLAITGKGKDFQAFCENYQLITREIPDLKDWIKAHPLKLITHNTWKDTLRVCKYFISTPQPDLYIRQLPIEVHTKYIQENRVIIQSLLEFLIPDDLNPDEVKFEPRFHLKYAEPLIRIRFLDTSLSLLEQITDISLMVSAFRRISVNCQNIFVVENLMNFLTLPSLDKTIALWSGGGFRVNSLRDIEWIKANRFFYWGDLDAQGFQILNQFRTYFPGTTAVMMDVETLSKFSFRSGTPAGYQNLQRLSETELKLYQYLQKNNIRLEQEKISQKYAEERIKKLCG